MLDAKFVTIDTRTGVSGVEKQAQEISNLVASGWDIISTTATAEVVFYVLRKERNA